MRECNLISISNSNLDYSVLIWKMRAKNYNRSRVSKWRNPHETSFKFKSANPAIKRRSGFAFTIHKITNKDGKKTVCKWSYSHVRILYTDVSHSLRMPGAYCREYNDDEHKIASLLSLPEKISQPPPTSEFDDRAGATDRPRDRASDPLK